MKNSVIPDGHQRAEALNTRKSFIVQAPAGSGKTEILTQRFLALLSCVKQPEEILAITFTKKSAAEMRARIINALKRADTEPEPAAEHAKTTWNLARNVLIKNQAAQWNLLDNPNRLRIQTIDSFNAHLTKQLPILSHFGSAPDITNDPVSLYREAVQEFLSHLEENVAWSDAIALLLTHTDNDLNKVESLLISMLAKRDQWLPYITLNASEPELRKKLETQLAAVVTDILSHLHKTFPKEHTVELLFLADVAAHHLKREAVPAELTGLKKDDENPLSNITYCANLKELPPAHPSAMKRWLGLSDLLLNKKQEWRKRFDKTLGFPAPSQARNPQEKQAYTDIKKRMEALIEHFANQEAFRAALIELNLAPSLYYEDIQWQTLDALHQVLRVAVAQLHLIFQKHGQIDYIESAQAALAALGTDDAPTDLTLALDYQLQHILIDEFQDTSHSQFRLIEKLTAGWESQDGRTLFVVGDPMQSIYRFREAEVGLFIQVRTYGLGHLTLHPLTLAVNFRSTAGIVNWVNEHFQKILPPFEDIGTGAISYSPSIASQSLNQTSLDDFNSSTDSKQTGNQGASLRSFNHSHDNKQPDYQEPSAPLSTPTHGCQPTEDNAVTLHAFSDSNDEEQAITIVQLIEKSKQERPDESIAILVRSRSHLQQIIPALKKARLSYRAIDIDPLNTKPIIQDLLALTRALLHPADRIAWLAILRAPWCGLTLSDLLLLSGDTPSVSIYERLQSLEVIHQLSPDGQQRLNRILPVLLQKMADRYRYSIRLWIESTWLLLGGPACAANSSELEDATAFLNLLSTMEQMGQLLNVDALTDKVSQLYAAANNQADNSLQIMTIHNAKGLEFDTVILPHLERRAPNDDKQLLLWMERPLENGAPALLIAPVHAIGQPSDSIYDHIKRQQAIKTDYESARLLYVAATRAKKKLHLLFSLPQKEDNSVAKPVSSSLLSKLWNAISSSIHATPNATNPLPAAFPSQTTKYISRLTLTWQNPIQEYSEKIAFHNKPDGFHLIENTPKIVGTLVHLLLQQISQFGATWWTSISLEQKTAYLIKNLTQRGTVSLKIPDAVNTILLAIHNTLTDPRGQWIIQNHCEAKNEFQLTTMVGEKYQSLIIDRTFVDKTGTRWIIDYKTALPNDHPIDHFILTEKNKYFQQMLNYANAMCKIDTRPIQLGLYFPLVPAWCEWNLSDLTQTL